MTERVLQGLQPERVFYYFEEISQIPRPSFHEQAIRDYLVSFAEDHGLAVQTDEAFNVIMTREASPGYENEEPIILQGHMDMVCETASGVKKDMTAEGLDLFVDGDLIGAKGTTLGADDGIAIAYALAILEDEELPTPRLEFVCTTSEEAGMEGAAAIDVSGLSGKQLINIDSEVEGELVCGCAGGARLLVTLPVKREEANGVFRQITVEGLLGGHSGTEIDKGRANAAMLMARVLRHILQAQTHPVRLASFTSGKKDNAIPREATAVISLSAEAAEEIAPLIEDELKNIQAEYGAVDPDIQITLSEVDPAGMREDYLEPISEMDTKRIVLLLLSLPNGVVRMNDHIEGLVETSLNLGILSLEESTLSVTYALRSSVEAAYEALRENMRFMAEGFGAEVVLSSEYPAWEFNPRSPLRKKLAKIYKEQTGKDPKILAIHAGLECGVLSGKIKGLDAVSLGPDATDIHTPNERLSISSTERVYRWLRTALSEKTRP